MGLQRLVNHRKKDLHRWLAHFSLSDLANYPANHLAGILANQQTEFSSPDTCHLVDVRCLEGQFTVQTLHSCVVAQPISWPGFFVQSESRVPLSRYLPLRGREVSGEPIYHDRIWIPSWIPCGIRATVCLRLALPLPGIRPYTAASLVI